MSWYHMVVGNAEEGARGRHSVIKATTRICHANRPNRNRVNIATYPRIRMTTSNSVRCLMTLNYSKSEILSPHIVTLLIDASVSSSSCQCFLSDFAERAQSSCS